jgi:hypothetical protein
MTSGIAARMNAFHLLSVDCLIIDPNLVIRETLSAI